ncbi:MULTISPECIES: FadR/GntR family transcriptional regulator [Pantoea]|uniref:FadR family transcriptional regulator n=1 Tax=Pantoea brenneri TaxID=472694 RepID=A0A654A1B5_9GAMM|nr:MULTISPECIES: FadR/GntR family transcriptional regulator [Pantoea]MBS6035077.1 FadR family transcriptional regulator [Pantoea sp.]MBZ6395756.1 FadR family transcriptional regulator [Pantoea sp.]MBZ6439077.1 FadR family transcriptional regulator [Pantoea sp.]MCQ5472842.1 FadR family transcriptional regulator [Pantoea brenneri]MDH1085640.1 FadR family transcriptional regulator [Pantoea brenneri]
MALPVVKTERLYRQIANAIMAGIDRGEFVAGGMLPPERELAKQLGVSRSSVREALIALEMTGWVDIRTGTGVFVSQPLPETATPQESEACSLQDLLQAREAFEGMLAGFAARNGTPAQRAALLALTAQLQQHAQNDAAFLEQDKRFHLLISEMSGNDLLREMLEQLWNKRHSPHVQRLERHFADNSFALEMNADHQQIANAIVAGDEVAARQAMENHLRHVQQRLLG